MPGIVGNFKVISVGSAGVVQIGDCLQISPSSNSKTYAGSGSFSTGDIPQTYNAISSTNTNDPDVKDSTQDSFGGNQGVGGSVI